MFKTALLSTLFLLRAASCSLLHPGTADPRPGGPGKGILAPPKETAGATPPPISGVMQADSRAAAPLGLATAAVPRPRTFLWLLAGVATVLGVVNGGWLAARRRTAAPSLPTRRRHGRKRRVEFLSIETIRLNHVCLAVQR